MPETLFSDNNEAISIYEIKESLKKFENAYDENFLEIAKSRELRYTKKDELEDAEDTLTEAIKRKKTKEIEIIQNKKNKIENEIKDISEYSNNLSEKNKILEENIDITKKRLKNSVKNSWGLSDWGIVNNKKDFNELFYNEIDTQPSLKGTAILSYLYSLKDGCSHQPLVADSKKSLQMLYEQMLLTPVGTDTTVILEVCIDEYLSHRTIAKIIKIDHGLKIISIDSVDGYENAFNLTDWDVSKESKLEFVHAKAEVARQIDGFSCLIYSIKDARELNRNSESQLFPNKDDNKPKLPPQFLKSSQSPMFFESVLPKFGNKIVNRKGKTLQEIIAKYTEVSKTGKHLNKYTEYFGKKFVKKIASFLEEMDIKTVKSIVETYDASKITAEELTKRSQERQALSASKNEKIFIDSSSDHSGLVA